MNKLLKMKKQPKKLKIFLKKIIYKFLINKKTHKNEILSKIFLSKLNKYQLKYTISF